MEEKTNSYITAAEKLPPKSSLGINCLKAFVSGGIICAIGQGIFDILYYLCGVSQTDGRAFLTIIMIFLGGALTGIGVYDDIGKFAGAGSIVPITGFANSIVSPAMEFKQEGYVFGVGAKLFTIAGPVLVYGISASVLAGIVYWLLNM